MGKESNGSPPFDPNTFILPADKAERKRLASLGSPAKPPIKTKEKKISKRALRKIEQLKRKSELEATRDETLKALQQYRITPEISALLKSSSSLNHKQRTVKIPAKRRVEIECSTDEEEEEVNDVQVERSNRTNCLNEPNNEKKSDIAPPRKNEDEMSFEIDSRLKKIHENRRDDTKYFERNIFVERRIEIEKQRTQLPAAMMEQEIVDLVINNDISIITGDTGCGKSTQVPQFLYEAGLCGNNQSIKALLIGITQPRRIAVTSACQRVGDELNDMTLVGYQVRYDKSVNTQKCRLKFMTDGILLRELQSDFLCSQYSVLVIDEAHERSVNCDILIGLLSRAVQLRRQRFNNNESTLRPLRLLIMSATLRIEDFTQNCRLFHQPPPVLKIDSRTHPVTLHFSRRTESDYIKAAANKTMQIHRKLPPGTVLVFVTGRREVHRLCSELRNRAQLFRSGEHDEDCEAIADKSQKLNDDGALTENEVGGAEDTTFLLSDDEEGSDSNHSSDLGDNEDNQELMKNNPVMNVGDEVFRLEDDFSNDDENFEYILQPDGTHIKYNNSRVENCTDEVRHLSKRRRIHKEVAKENVLDDEFAEALGFDSGKKIGSINPKIDVLKQDHQWLGGGNDRSVKLKVIPLYALLTIKDQSNAFYLPKENERVIIVSTNVAETSLTLPNIRYVVDCGREKKRQILSSDVASVFSIQWISKASADQRAGRAGRIGPGHCYRLYSTAIYTNTLTQFPPINLFLTPLDSVLLFMASLGIPDVTEFPFPNPPPEASIQRARSLLLALGALQYTDEGQTTMNQSKRPTIITPLGRLMAKLPVSPRFAIMIVSAIAKARASQSSIVSDFLIQSCAALVAGWSVGNLIDLDYDLDECSSNQNKSKNKKKSIKTSDTTIASLPYHQYTSDIHSILWILSNFIESKNKLCFCRSNKLHHRQLSESVFLYNQLLSVIKKQFNVTIHDTGLIPQSLSISLSSALHDCALLGVPDNIAVRCDLLPGIQSKSTSARSGYYCSDSKIQLASNLDPRLFVHNSSAVHKLRPRPQFIAFYQITNINPYSSTEPPKRFIRSCFPVDPISLSNLPSPLIQLSDFLSTPSPFYSADLDEVVGFVRPRYLPLEIDLPSVKQPLTHHCEVKLRLFAKALLEGEVILFFKQFHNRQISYLRYQPSCLIRSNPLTHGSPDISLSCPSLTYALAAFVDALQTYQCATRRSLIQVWNSNPEFLLKEFQQLLSPTCPNSLTSSLETSWPPSSF